MLLRLFLLFTLVPLLELLLLLRLGALVGLGPTLLLVLGTGLAGAWLARREGLRSWRAVQSELAAGRLPAVELLHSLLILVAGAVLVTPGVLTDLAGLLLLVRPVRAGLIGGLRRRFERGLSAGVGGPGAGGPRVFWWGTSPAERGPDRVGADRSTRVEDAAEDAGRTERRPRVIEL